MTTIIDMLKRVQKAQRKAKDISIKIVMANSDTILALVVNRVTTMGIDSKGRPIIWNGRDGYAAKTINSNNPKYKGYRVNNGSNEAEGKFFKIKRFKYGGTSADIGANYTLTDSADFVNSLYVAAKGDWFWISSRSRKMKFLDSPDAFTLNDYEKKQLRNKLSIEFNEIIANIIYGN